MRRMEKKMFQGTLIMALGQALAEKVSRERERKREREREREKL